MEINTYVRLKVKVTYLEVKMQTLWIVYSLSYVKANYTIDVAYWQLEMLHGMPQNSIQMKIWKKH